MSWVKDLLSAFQVGGVTSFKDLIAGLQLGFEGLAKTIGVSTAALGAFLVVAAAVAAVVGASIYSSQRYDRAANQASEATQAYEEQQQKVESLNSELETTQQRIDELQSKGSLTFVEREELANLQTQNALLEQQLETAKAIAQYRETSAQNAANEALNTKGFTLWADGTGGKNSFLTELAKIGMTVNGMSGQSVYEEVDIVEYAIRKQEQLNKLTEKRAELIKKQSETDDARELEKIENEITKNDKLRAEIQGEIASRWGEIEQYQQTITEDSGNALKGYEETVARIKNLQTAILDYNEGTSKEARTKQERVDSFLDRPTLKEDVEAAKSAANELNGISVDQFKEQFPDLAEAVENAGLDIVDVVNTINSAVNALNIDTVADKLRDKLVGLFDTEHMGDASLAHLEERMSDFVDGLDNEEIRLLWGIFMSEDTSAWTFEDIQAALENAKTEAVTAANAISEALTNAFTGVKSEASAVSKALEEQGATGNLSLDTYKELVALSGDYAKCLTTENGALQLNAEKAQELTDTKIELEMAQIDLQKALDIEQWKKNAAQIADYESRLDELDDTQKQSLETWKAANAQLQDNINQYNLMKAELQDLTSVYQNWVNAQKLGTSRDMYDSLQNAKKQIEEALKSGETGIGNPLYQAALKLMVPENMQGDVAAYMKKLERYLTEGATGLKNFWDDLIKEGFVIQEDDAQNLVPDATIDAIAERLNLKSEVVESMFHALEMYDGFEFHFGEANVDVSNIQSAVDEYKALVAEANELGVDLERTVYGNIDTGNRQVLEWTEESIEQFRDALESWGVAAEDMLGSISTVFGGSEEFDGIEIAFSPMLQTDHGAELLSADTVRRYINELIDKAGEGWTNEDLLRLDAEGLEIDGQRINSLIADIGDTAIATGEAMHFTGPDGAVALAYEELKKAADEAGISVDALIASVEQGVEVNISTVSAQEQLDELDRQIQEKEAELAKLTTTNADGAVTLKVETDKSEYDALNAEIEALKQQKQTIEIATSMNGGADAEPVTKALEEIRDFEIEDKEFSVTAVDNATPILSSIKSMLDAIKSKTVTITTEHVDSYHSNSGDGEANAYGTSNAGGGTTLVGELGRELVVSGNRYYTVGDYGAEFVDLKPGDIVFNHGDTEKIFKGLSGAHGQALAQGNAAVIGGVNAISGGTGNTNSLNAASNANIGTMNAEAETVELNAENVAYDEVYEGVNYAGWSWADAKSYQEKQRQENTSTLEEMLARRNSPEVREADNLLIRGARYQDEAVTFGGQGRTQSGTDLNGASTLFEHYYNKYQHDLAMGRISKLEYANWLSQAVPAAQRQGQIYDTETVYQYLEEVLSATKEAMEEVRKLKENAVELMELDLTEAVRRGDFDAARDKIEDITAAYQDLMDTAHAQAEWFRANGYADNSDEVSELSKLWFEYRDAIVEAVSSAHESVRQEYENTITLTEDSLNQAISGRDYANVRKYADDIEELYRKMQEDLHEQAEYYRALGYSDTSEEVSELSHLWWEYEEKRVKAAVEAWEQIVDAAHSAVDKIQDVYDKLHAAAQEYAENGDFISVDAFQEITKLGVQYLRFLEDENGLLVINDENLNKIIAAKTEELALDTALEYVERLRLAAAGKSNETVSELLYAIQETSGATWDLVYAQLAMAGLSDEEARVALRNINMLRSLADSAISGIGRVAGVTKAELDEMKDGLDDILDYVMDMLKHRIEDNIDSLEKMKDAYAEIISQRKEALKLAKSENDYQKKIKDKLQEMAKLQAQIDILSLDNSRDAQAQRAKLLEQMAELQKEIEDEQNEYAVSAQEDALSDLQEAYEKEKDSEIDVLKDSISSTEKLYRMAMDYLENDIGSDYERLKNELCAWNYDVGNSFESEVVAAWEDAIKAAERYGSLVAAMQMLPAETSSSYDSDVHYDTVSPSNNYDTSAYAAGQTARGTEESTAVSRAPDVKLVQEDGSAPAGMSVGDYVVTAGGLYRITGVNSDGGYSSDLIEPYSLTRDGTYQKYQYWLMHKSQLPGYSKGGVIDYDGLAEVHGGSGSEMVLNNRDVSKLYEYIHNTPSLVDNLMNMLTTPRVPDILGTTGSLSSVLSGISPGEANITMGDIIINGNADEKTVRDIRTITRRELNQALKLAGI